MPMYEYECRKCKKSFDKLLRSMSASNESEKVECPGCGSKQTQRKLSVVAVGSAAAKSAPAPQGGCGRCGGPGPCAFD
jgi:putative FmdB family regulatory protein